MAPAKISLLDEIQNDVLTGKPLADALRKCVVLGGQAGSAALRDWATKELRGYKLDDELPDYREISAPILIDGVNGHRVFKRMTISSASIPDFAREHFNEDLRLPNGVGELEDMERRAHSEGGSIALAPAQMAALAGYMDHEIGNPFQSIHRIYWSISATTIHGLLDQVRTRLTELVAEMRAGMSNNQEVPSVGLADQALNVAIHGAKRVTLNTAQSSGASTSTVTAAPEPEAKGFWSNPKWLGLTGVGTVVLVWIAAGAPLHWWPFP